MPAGLLWKSGGQGAGPRASQALILGAKARAVLSGRFAAEIDDVRALSVPVLRHRMGLNFAAQSDGVSTDDIVAQLLETKWRLLRQAFVHRAPITATKSVS